jgi:hypothetical protein
VGRIVHELFLSNLLLLKIEYNLIISVGWSIKKKKMAENLENEIEEERKHFKAVLAAFNHYLRFSYVQVQETESYLNTLNNSHQDVLENYRGHLNIIRESIKNIKYYLKLTELN